MDKSPSARIVTDHAILRYVERILGIDLRSTVLEAILCDGREELIKGLKNGEIRIGKTNTVLRVVNGQVFTVITHDSRSSHKPTRKARKEPCG